MAFKTKWSRDVFGCQLHKLGHQTHVKIPFQEIDTLEHSKGRARRGRQPVFVTGECSNRLLGVCIKLDIANCDVIAPKVDILI